MMIRIHIRENISRQYHKFMAWYHSMVIKHARLDVGEYGYHRNEQLKHERLTFI